MNAEPVFTWLQNFHQVTELNVMYTNESVLRQYSFGVNLLRSTAMSESCRII